MPPRVRRFSGGQRVFRPRWLISFPQLAEAFVDVQYIGVFLGKWQLLRF
jgi:hypothetical protein